MIVVLGVICVWMMSWRTRGEMINVTVHQMNQRVAILLNSPTAMRCQIVPEEYIVESIRALFFHLSPSPFISFRDARFQLNPKIATRNYTAQSVQSLVRAPLQASDALYTVRSFVFRTSDSPVQSTLQEGFHTYIIKPMYEELEKFHPKTLMELLLKGKVLFDSLKNALKVINSSNQIEDVFILAKNGCEQMMNVSVMLLRLFYTLCSDIITNKEPMALNVKGFFISKKDNVISYSNVPSVIPIGFVDDIVKTAESNDIRKEIGYVEILNYIDFSFADLDRAEKLLSLDNFFILEKTLDEFPKENISSFRANAWEMCQISINEEIKESKNDFKSIDKAVESILTKPLWENAKQIQKDTVRYILDKQKLLDMINMLSILYLMRRGDLHHYYISKYCSFENAIIHFSKYIKHIPLFNYEFILPNSIQVKIPFKLRKIITQEQLVIYNQYFQYISTIKSILFEISSIKAKKSYFRIRIQMIHFLTSIFQTTVTYTDYNLRKLINDLKTSMKIEELASNHSKFVRHLKNALFLNSEEVLQQIQLIVELCNKFINEQERNIQTLQQQFQSYKTHLINLLIAHYKKDPNEMTSSLIDIIK